MKRLLSKLWFQALLGAIFLFVIGYFGAEIIGAAGFRLNVGLFLAVLWLIGYAGFWAHGKFNEWRLSRELKKQNTPESPGNAELSELERDFQRAIGQLEANKAGLFSDQAGGLPWVVILGPPGTGKTTTLDASGLRFTKLGRKVQGVGGTRNCEWWLSKDGIFLDTAGRYSVHREDRDEWLGFLRLLARFRPHRPIDAAVIQISMDEIINLVPEEVEEIGLELQDRLHELMDTLSIRFPVYFIFSKMDQIDGFEAFFDGMEREERLAPWGFTLDLDQLAGESLDAAFETRFTRIIDAARTRRDLSLLQLSDTGKMEEVLYFTKEMERSLPNLSLLVDVVFEPRSQSERPWLTHVFMVSAEQDGATLGGQRERLLDTIGALHLPHEAPPAPVPHFIRGAFQHLSQQARNAARPTSKAATRQKRRRKLLTACLTTGVLIGGALAGIQYAFQVEWLRGIQAEVKDLSDGVGLPRDLDLLTHSNLAHELEDQLSVQRQLAVHPGGTLVDDAQRIAIEHLRKRIESVLIEPMKPSLDADLKLGANWEHSSANERQSEEDFVTAYEAIRADWILRNDQVCSGIDPEDSQAIIAAYLARLWIDATSADRRSQIFYKNTSQVELQKAIAHYFTLAPWEEPLFDQAMTPGRSSSMIGDPSLVTKAKEKISEKAPSTAYLTYLLMIAEGGLRSLETPFTEDALEAPGILRAFTYEGCQEFQSFDGRSKAWWSCILGNDNIGETSEARSEYDQRYEQAWETWLEGVAFKEVKTITELRRFLGELEEEQDSTGSELNVLMLSVGGTVQDARTEMELIDVPNSPKLNWYQRLRYWFNAGSSVTKQLADKVEAPPCRALQSRYEAYSECLDKGTPCQTAFKRYKANLAELRDILGRIDDNGHVDKEEALKLVTLTLNKQGPLYALRQSREDVITAIQNSGQRNSRPSVNASSMDKLLMQIESTTVALLLPPAMEQVASDWEDDIWQSWSPINSGSRYAPEDCQRRLDFMEGKAFDYYDKYIAQFYENPMKRGCSSRTLLDQKINIETSLCGQMATNRRLTSNASCPEDPTPTPPPEPPRLAKFDHGDGDCGYRIDEVELKLGGQRFTYNASNGRFPRSDREPDGTYEISIKTSHPRDQNRDPISALSARTLEDFLAKAKRSGNFYTFKGLRGDICRNKLSVTIKLIVPKQKTSTLEDPSKGLIIPEKIVIAKESK